MLLKEPVKVFRVPTGTNGFYSASPAHIKERKPFLKWCLEVFKMI